MASNGWEKYKERRGMRVEKDGEYQPAKNTNGYTWEQYKAKRAGQEIPKTLDQYMNPVKRGTYTSEVTTPYSEAAAAAYRKFKGEDAPASSLRVGAGEAASGSMKKIGPGEYSQLRTKRIGAGEEMVRDTQIGRKKAEDVRTYADDLHNRFGRELADVTPEVFEQRPEGKSIGGIVQNVPGLNVDLEIASRYGIDPQKFGGIAKEAAPGKRIGAGEAALTDPQYIGYENLKTQPDFAQYAAKGKTGRPEEAEAENAQGLLWEIFTNPAGIRDSIETSYMTREEEQNYDYLLGKYGTEEAERYYRSIEDAINQRKGVAQYENTQTLPGWAKTAYEASMPVTSGLDQTISGVAALGDVLMGDRQARGVSPSLYADALLRERLNAESGWKIPFTDVGWKQALHDAVQTTAAQIPQYAMNLATGGGMSGWAVLYASAFGNAYSEKRREGASFGQSVATGIESALVEGLSEKIGGFAMGSDATLVRKLFGNKLDNIASPILKALTETGLDAAGEGLEEVIAEVAAPIAEEYIMSDAEDERTFVDKLVDGLKAIKRSDLVYAGALGAATGGAMTGPVNTVNAISEARTKAAQASAQSVKSKETTPEQKHNAAKKALEIADVENAEELADAVVKMANGEELTQDEMQAVATTEGALEVVKEIAGTEVVEDASVDMELNERAYEMGRAGMAKEDAERLLGTGDASREAAFMSGQERMRKQQAKRTAQIEHYAQGKRPAMRRGTVADISPREAQEYNVRTIDRRALSKKQKSATKALDVLAQATGMRFVLYESNVGAQGREGRNGWYDNRTQTAYIDIASGYNGEEAMLRTAAHETTHFIENWSPNEYAKLRDFLVEFYHGKGENTLNALVLREIDVAQAAGRQIDETEAMHEVVANACEMMLSDPDAIKALAERNTNLFVRIKLWLDGFVDSIRRVIVGVNVQEEAARALMDDSASMREAQKLWFDALEDASVSLRGKIDEEVRRQIAEIEQNDPGTDFILIPGTDFRLVDYSRPQVIRQKVQRRQRPTGIAVRGETGLVPVQQEAAAQPELEEEFIGFDTASIRERLQSGESRVPEMIAQAEAAAQTQEKPKKTSAAFRKLLVKWSANEWVNQELDGSAQAKAFERWAEKWYNAGKEGMKQHRVPFEEADTEYPAFLQDEFYKQGVKEAETSLKRKNARKTAKSVKKKEASVNGEEGTADDGTVSESGQVRPGDLQLLEQREEADVQEPGRGRETVRDDQELGRESGQDDGSADGERPVRVGGVGDREGADLRERLSDDAPDELTVPEAIEQAHEEMAVPAVNFHIEQLELPRGEKARFNANVEAIRTVKQIISENRQATAEEQKVLSLYVGWGGIANAFDETKSAWKKEYNLLRSLLTEEEYAAAKASTLNAHYTEIGVIKAMYEGLRKWGFQGGRMLEPSAGIGHFVGAMPSDMAQSVAGWRIVELDTITGQIAKYLYPQAKTYIQGFETVKIPDNFIDVAIGNVPFGDYPIVDAAYPKAATQSIHNYFFAKAIDKVRPGGILMFITSRYTMDSQNASFREYMAQRADLLGAVRLPKTAFKGNAGTEVVTDIIVMQKREKGVDMSSVTKQFAQYTAYNSFVGNAGYTNAARINAYFNLHPDMVLGKMSMTGTMYGGNELTVEDNGKPLAPQIIEALGRIKARMTYDQKLKPEYAARAAIQAQKATKNNGYERREDGIYQNIDGELTKVEMSADDRQRVEGMLDMRDTARSLLAAQIENRSTEEIKELRAKLNAQYDAFVEKNGYLNSQKNKKAMGADPDKAFLQALEKYDAKEKTAKKADIFRKNTVAPSVTIERADSAADALGIVLNETGRIDLDRIAQLTHMSREDAEKSLLGARIAFRNADGALEARNAYLSGNVREKLRIARELAEEDEGYLANVEELEKVQPLDVEYKDIYVKLGATWIPDEVYTEFMRSVLGYNWRNRGNDIRYDSISGKYVVDAKNSDYGYSLANSTEYGAGGYTFLDILDANLNSRTLSVRREGADGRRVIDADSTMAVQEMQKKVNEKFQTWLWEDEKRRNMLANLYNETFNSDVLREYDGEGLTINGANVEKQLRPHQRRAVQRIVQQGGNVLLAHKVGAGKTAEMAGAAMKLRQLGIIKKPMFVVPKNLVAQWGDEFLDFFPGAHILVLSESDFTPGNRKIFANKIATGDYDAVILSYEQFEKIPMSMEAQQGFYQEQIDAAEAAKDAAAAAKGGKGRNVKQNEKSIMRMRAKLQKLNAVKRDTDNIIFEDMGVDGIFVDEAHNFKNLFYTTSMQVNGLGNAEGAKRTFDMYMKVRYLQQLNGGKGIVFATATPVMNSMVEMYTMQRYLQPDVLKRLKIDNFDAWANMFGEVIDTTEMTPAGDGWRVTKSFSRFKNMPELQTLFRSVSDVLTDIPDLKVPKLRQGKRILIESDPTEFQMEFIKELAERADAIKSGKVNSSEDNMLKITGEGRKLALSQKLIDSGLDYGEGSKVYKCAETVMQEYKASREIKGTQIVFCDLSTPKKSASGEDAAETDDVPDVYNELRRQLIGRGIPAKEIAFIHDYDTNEKKQKLFDSVRKGDVRVLIGSTAKMGVGMNVQERVVALHHMDCPWRPGDLEQREGRALRQGNINEEVAVYTYITKKTFDSRMWGNIERKQGFISQVMNGANTSREIEGDELALSAAEIKAAASGNPLIIEQLGVQNEINRLQGLYRAHMQKRQQAAIDANVARATLAATQEKLPKVKADAERAQDTSGDRFVITISGKTVTNREEAGNALIVQAKKRIDKQSAKTFKIGEFAGFDLIVDTTLKTGVRGQLDWMADVNPESANGTIRMLENRVRVIAANVNAMQARIVSTTDEIRTLEAVASEPFDRQDKLDELLKRNAEIAEILNPAQREAVVGDEEGVEASERDVEYRSDRELLAGALETVAVSEQERQALARYKKQIERLDRLSDELKEVNAGIRRLSFEKGERDQTELAKLKTRKQVLENTLTREDKALLRLERSQMLKDVLEVERKKAARESKAKADKRIEYYKERISADKYKEHIAKKVAQLSAHLTKPTTKQYIPEPIRGPVAEFLSSIRFTSKRALKGGEQTKKDEAFVKNLRALQNVLSRVKSHQAGDMFAVVQENFGGYLDLPEGFIENLTDLAEKVERAAQHSPNGYDINAMTRDQLKDLSKMITVLTESILNVNKFLAENLYRHVDDAARDTIWDLKEMGKRERHSNIGKYLEWSNALPVYAFDRFGRGGKAIFGGLRKGQAKLAFNAKQVIDFAEKTFSEKEVKQWQGDVKEFSFGEETIRIPVTHIMSLYCLMKREQAMGHLHGEGFRVANYDLNGKVQTDSGHTVDDRMLAEIVGVLSDRQKQVADALQKYMVDVGGEWGNFVSMRRFGYKFFEEPYYFPINSDGNHLPGVSEEGGKGNALYALLNISPTKELAPKANNRLMLHNIFDVFANHMSDMAQYNAFALPVLDAIKWLNYKESTKDRATKGRKTLSIQDVLTEAYGDPAKQYLIRMIEDVSGRKATGRDDAVGMNMLRRYNRAQVAANLRVVLLQPMSFFRAGMELNALPMMKGALKNIPQLKGNVREMLTYSGIAQWKDLGFYDANIARGVRSMIKHDQNIMSKASDTLMKGAEWADKITWAAIWQVCKEQTARTIDPADAGYMDAVAEKFEETIYRTQVADGVLMKSQYMRNPDFLHKWTSSFMSEPTTSYNMLANAVWKTWDDARRSNWKEAWRKNNRYIGRTATVFAATTVLTTMLEMLMTAWRDEDDYETFLEKMKDGAVWTLIDNANPIAMLPAGSILWNGAKSVMKVMGVDTYGYDMTNPLTEGIDLLIDTIESAQKVASGSGSITAYGAAYNGMKLVSGMTGFPVASIAREGVSMWNNTIASWNPAWRVQRYRTSDVVGASSYVKAVRENNDRLAAEMLEELEANNVTGGALLDAVEDAIKAAYKSGGMGEDEAARLLEKYGRYPNKKDDKYAAERLVREWDTRAQSGNATPYGHVWNYISDWDGNALKAEIKELKALGVEESSIRTSVTNHFKDEYLQATGREKTDLKAHLITALTMLGMSSAEAKKKIESWKEE